LASRFKPLRYLRVSFFFLRAFAHVFFWDVLLERDGLRWLRPDPKPRWRKIARRFRRLAVRKGGLLIKLGQFLSIRVDILPPEITRELEGLQDKLPREDFAVIRARLIEELGGPLEATFREVEEEPLGAASLAQAHRAVLCDGRPLVVKVLRPGIEGLVETDLAATGLACSWLKLYRPIASKVDLDWLIRELAATTRTELDMVAEAGHIERFASFFADDPGLHFPEVFTDISTRRILALENVAFIKVDRTDRLREVGIEPDGVARALFAFHMRQIFDQHMVHADPHPGNLFIRPLPTEEERAAGRTHFEPGEPVPHATNRDFQIAPVDFGMVAEIPTRLRQALRSYVLGIAGRDAKRIVRSYVEAGTLLPGADLERLEEAHEALLERVWGVGNDQLQDAAGDIFDLMMKEYRDILFDTPFQAQVDLLFTIRSVEMLNGLVTRLDPDFNLWDALIPFAKKLALRDQTVKKQVEEAIGAIRELIEIPRRLSEVLTQAERGTLTVRNALAPETRRRLDRIERGMRGMKLAVLAGAALVAGALLRIGDGAGMLDEVLIGLGLLAGLRSSIQQLL